MLYRFFGLLTFVFALTFASVAHAKDLDPALAHNVIDGYTESDHNWKPSNLETLGDLLSHYRFGNDVSVYERITTATSNASFCEATAKGIRGYSESAKANNRLYEIKATPEHLKSVATHLSGACPAVKTAFNVLLSDSVAYHKPPSDSDYRICSYKDFRPFHDACLSKDNSYVTGAYEDYAVKASSATLLKLCTASYRGSYQYSIAAQVLRRNFPSAPQCTREAPTMYYLSASL